MGMDHYVKIKEFGGVSGAILAQDKQNPSKKVVIKRVSDGAQGMEELGASLRARHPNIVKFEESFVTNGCLYVALRYEPGGDLDRLLSRLLRLKRFPTTLTLLMWFTQMLDALAYCHKNNILHRDIKPSNIFLSEDTKTLYLGDFGSAKTLGTGNVTTTFVGSPMWISPEVLIGTPYSYSSDVWSMGCVFYEMATLRRPFGAPNFARLVQQITAGRVAPLPAALPPPVRELILSMLVVDPEQRPTAAELLATVQRDYAAEKRRVESQKRQSPQPRPAPAPASPLSPPSVLATGPAAHGAPAAGEAESAQPPAKEEGAFVNPQAYHRPPQPDGPEGQGPLPPPPPPPQRGAADGSGQRATPARGSSAAAAAHASPEKATPPPAPPLRQLSTPTDEAAAADAASAEPYDRSLSLSPSDAVGAADGVVARPAPEAASGKAVAMFVAITPRGPRKKTKSASPAVKKKRPPQQRPPKAAKSPPPDALAAPAKRVVGSAAVLATPPHPLQVFQRAPTAPASSASSRLRGSVRTDNQGESAVSHPGPSTNRAGPADGAAGGRPKAVGTPPAAPPIAKSRALLVAQPGILQQRLASARARAKVDSDEDSSGSEALTPAEEMRKSQWIRAKRHDVSDIEGYLMQFRGHDEELLHSFDDASGADSVGRRRPSLVGRAGSAAAPASTSARRGPLRPSPEAVAPPAPPQQLQRGVRKSISNASNPKKAIVTAKLASPERLRRMNSSVSNLNGTTNSLGYRGVPRQASNAHASQPRSQEEQQRIEEERRAAREKREAERDQMAQMIREQRQQHQQQRKAKKKTDPFDVKIAMPGRA